MSYSLDLSNIVIVSEAKAFQKFARHIRSWDGPIFLDTEGSGLDPHTVYFALLQLRFDGVTYVLDFTKLDKEFWNPVAYYLKGKKGPFVAHNMVFDQKMLFHHGVVLDNVYCTMLAEQDLKAGLYNVGYGLDDVAERRLGIKLDKTIRDRFIALKPGDTIDEDMLIYSADDVIVLEPIYYQQQQEIDEEGLRRTIDEIEMPCVPVTTDMEYQGICVDKKHLQDALPVVAKIIANADKAIQDAVIQQGLANRILFTAEGYTAINTASPKQMLSVLQAMGISVTSMNSKELSDWDNLWSLKQAKGDTHSASAMVFDTGVDLDEDQDIVVGFTHPFLRKCAIRSAAAKLEGTYYKGILDRINPVTNRIHPGFRQCGAVATGRFSSTNPNFQNLPNIWRLRDLGLQDYDVRAAFVAAPGKKFIICDYSGIELVILAALSGDENLHEQILGGDIHSFVGNALMGDIIEQVLGERLTKKNAKVGKHKIIRDEFKRVSYGIVYGSTGWNLYRTCYPVFHRVGIGITQATCDGWVQDWQHKLFPRTGKLLQENAHKAVTQLYTTSVTGRRRRWDASVRTEKWKFLKAQREGMNQPIQSTSADITKLSMSIFYDRVDRERGRLVACVHDENVAEADLTYVDECAIILKESMEDAGYRLLPDLPKGMIVADPKISDRYDK